MREKGSGTRQVIDSFLREQGINLSDLNITIEIGDITAIISLVESNQGCTIISKEVLRKFRGRDSLRNSPYKRGIAYYVNSTYCSLTVFRMIYFEKLFHLLSFSKLHLCSLFAIRTAYTVIKKL